MTIGSQRKSTKIVALKNKNDSCVEKGSTLDKSTTDHTNEDSLSKMETFSNSSFYYSEEIDKQKKINNLRTIQCQIVQYYLNEENMKGSFDINMEGLNREMSILFTKARLSSIEKIATPKIITLVHFKNFRGNIGSFVKHLNREMGFPLVIEKFSEFSVTASFIKDISQKKFNMPTELKSTYSQTDIDYLWRCYFRIRRDISDY